MRPFTASIAAICALVLAVAPITAAERSVPCKGNPALVGACFTVRGTMSAHNGTPTFRIYVIATHRMLGVHGEQDGLPPDLIPTLMAPNNDAFGKLFDGDYTVCPFTPERAGHMRMVCVEDAKNVRVHVIEP